ncbi:basic phospholipase A2 caudoxin-like [Limulus polyphemus]|uniref:Phospholipase A2 n=1 Tax=Limulus polyphemus TaxID=6850 RepID=A0ABM1B3P4_LIMPO|nr:basic phospholipase A2 caudoxin-like [Limulus polyphemus]
MIVDIKRSYRIAAHSLQMCSNNLDSSKTGVPRLAQLVTSGLNDLHGVIDKDQEINSSKGLSKQKARTARARRSILQLANVLHCVTGCNPLTYKGYGCYCGYMGEGEPVDEIDRCCLEHDWCYTYSDCPQLLIYFVSYRFECVAPGYAHCENDHSMSTDCAAQLCECDRVFAHCVSKYSCPSHRATCLS